MLPPARPHPVVAHVVALLATLAAALTAWSLGTLLDTDMFYLPFVGAVASATAFGGLGPGLVALVLSVTAGLVLTAPLDDQDLVRVVLYVPFAALVGGIAYALRRTRDTIERQQAHLEEERQRLAVSERRLAVAQEAGNIGTFDWNIATGTLEWSRQLEQIFGLIPGAFAGTFESWRERIDPQDLAVLEADIQRTLDAHRTEWHAEYRIHRAGDHDLRWIDARARIFYTEDGAPARMLGVNIDVTERKRLEEVLHQADRLKDEFLATVSHELRTPLNAILGWSRLLISGQLDAGRSASAFGIIERNGRALAQLVEDLLDVSRIISGKLRLDVAPVDLPAVIRQAVEAVRPLAEGKQLAITTRLGPAVGPVAGDAARLQQVVWNLLSNAVKFTPAGGAITVTLSYSPQGACIEVSDTGIGIAPEFLPLVFDRFRQADGSSTRQHSGLGLGLAIVRHLVELHGGTVEASSGGRNHGATFCVRLPIGHGEMPGERRGPIALPPFDDSCLVDLNGVRVLLVEDDRDGRELVATMLRRCGAIVTAVASVDEAMRALAGPHRPGVVVSDIGMPGEDGFDLIRRLRALPEQAGGRLPAAAVTGYVRADDRARILAAGYQTHIRKPVDPSELIAAVAALAGRAGRA